LTLPIDDGRIAAGQLWELGQAAMRHGQPDAAIDYYQRSLQANAAYSSSHLSLAAAYMEKQDPASASVHLAIYLEANPEQTAVRVRYAELLLRLKRRQDASAQFERTVADAQGGDESAHRDLISCHSRLASMAEEDNDAYGEHLNRGVGLFLLAGQRRYLSEANEELPVESLLIKAAAELTHARLQKPGEARPCWYLYLAWSQLGQRQPALCRLREAASTAPFSALTPTERRELEAAHSRLLQETTRR
jgi:hypothetical protein